MSRRVHPWPVNRLGHCSTPLASTPLVIRIILPPLPQVLETPKRLVGEAHDEHPYPAEDHGVRMSMNPGQQFQLLEFLPNLICKRLIAPRRSLALRDEVESELRED